MTVYAPAGGATRSRNRRPLLLAALALGLLLSELDQFVLATALPTIIGDLHAVGSLLWVNTAFVLTGTLAMPAYGLLGDRLGRRTVFMAALAIFVLGSVLGGLAPSMPVLIAARAVQGLGGGGLLILVQAIVADVVAARERLPYLTAIDAVFAVAAVSGPVIGGALAETVGWRWAFWINLPVGVVAIVAAAVLVPASPRPARTPRPELPRYGLTSRNATLATGAGLLLGLAVFGTVGYLPSYLQLVHGLSPTRAGLMMLTLIGGLAVATIGSAQLVRRTGRYQPLPVAGAGLVVVALLGLASLGPHDSLGEVGLYFFGLGLGIGSAWDVLVLVVQNAVSPNQVGAATAANGFFREVGVLLGTALVGALFTARLGALLAERLPGSGLVIGPEGVTPHRLAQLPPEARDLLATAYADALTPVFGLLVPPVLLALVALCLIRSEPLADRGRSASG